MHPEDSLAQAYAEELPWLAFLYVSEELTPDEVVDFEERLLTDQAAREAVAEAMKLADGVWLASAMSSYQTQPSMGSPTPASELHPTDRQNIRRWALWTGSTLALAVLAFCVGWWFAEGRSNPSTRLADQTDSPKSLPAETDGSPAIEGAEELVGLWSDSQDLLAVLGPSSELPAELHEEEPNQENADSEEEAFAWMLAAVSAGSGEMPNDTPEVMEN